VIDTARYFASGFFGLDWNHTNSSTLLIIPEDFDMGANTLTPGISCLKYRQDDKEGHDQGYNLTKQFVSTYAPAIRQRLLTQNPGIEFEDDEIYAMQEFCGFEITVRGSSPWCALFSQNEFLGFEYARDLLHYYRAGPGTKYAGAMGGLWVNATLKLMLEGPGAGSLFFSL
jgi:acid phosphatase